MAFKLPPVTVLPGGRKVRDVSALSVDKLEAVKEQAAVVGEPEDELEQQPVKKPAKQQAAEDESVG